MWNLHQYDLWRWTRKCMFGCVSKLPALLQTWIFAAPKTRLWSSSKAGLPFPREKDDVRKEPRCSPKGPGWGLQGGRNVGNMGCHPSQQWSLLHKWQEFMGTPLGMDLQGTGKTNRRVRGLGCLLHLCLKFAWCTSDYIHRVIIIYLYDSIIKGVVTVPSYRDVLEKQMNILLFYVHALPG